MKVSELLRLLEKDGWLVVRHAAAIANYTTAQNRVPLLLLASRVLMSLPAH